MAFHDDDASASQTLINDDELHEDKSWQRRNARKFPILTSIYVLAAHVLGWMLALHFASPTLFSGYSPTSGDDINKIVPSIKSKLVRFQFETDDWVPGPNDPNVTDTIFENWSKMLPNGNGMVKITDWEDYPYLTEPSNLVNNETAFNTAWVHQLHCVYWVMREYHRVLHHGPDGTEYFIDPTHNAYHTSHCFNYIRQAILCGLDTTLEGSGDGVGVADGSGQMHVCRDDQQSIEWLEAHRFIDFQAIS